MANQKTLVMERNLLDGNLVNTRITKRVIYTDKAGDTWVSYHERKYGKKATPLPGALQNDVQYTIDYNAVTINGGKSGQAFSDAVTQAKRKAVHDYLRSLGLNIYG